MRADGQLLDHVAQWVLADPVLLPPRRSRPGTVWIYALIDEWGRPRYVGKTKVPRDRWRRHMREAVAPAPERRNRRHRWIVSMLRGGNLPLMIWLSEAGEDDWQRVERLWIARLRHDYGDRIVNGTEGGEGAPGLRHSAATRAKQSERALKRPPVSDETRRRLSYAGRARLADPRERERLAERSRGRRHTPETRRRIGDVHRRPDVVARKRELNSGEMNHEAILTWDAVREIRRRLSDGEQGKVLAAEFGISQAQMSRIRRNQSWREDLA